MGFIENSRDEFLGKEKNHEDDRRKRYNILSHVMGAV